MSGTHAILSPSKGAMILRCAAALAAGKNAPNPSSEYAAEGTAYHDISARVLDALGNGGPGYAMCAAYVGVTIEADGYKFTIDEENAAYAQVYVDAIRRIPGEQFYEVRLDTSEIVGVPGQGGTGDAVTLDFENDTIHVDDLKFGRGEVVFAENNEQLIQYGAAALRRFALLHDWKHLKLGIHQPRIGHYSEHTMCIERVEMWIAENRPKFQRAFELYQDPAKLTLADFVPGDKQCRWCPIRGACTARTNNMLQQFPISPPAPKSVTTTLTDEALAAARSRVDDIEQWCSDIKAEAHTRAVHLGRKLPGWKVVDGKKGNRKLDIEKPIKGLDGETDTTPKALIDAMVGEDAYEPAHIKSASKLQTELEQKKHPKVDIRIAVWAAIQPAISQAEGSKSLVRDDSPKQAVATPNLEFPIAPV